MDLHAHIIKLISTTEVIIIYIYIYTPAKAWQIKTPWFYL